MPPVSYSRTSTLTRTQWHRCGWGGICRVLSSYETQLSFETVRASFGWSYPDLALLGSAVQDHEVPPGLPGPVRLIKDGEGTSAGSSSSGTTPEHRHGDISLLTAQQVHFGRAPEVIENRQQVLAAAYAARPDRFAKRPPKLAKLPAEAWINRALPVTSANGAKPANGGRKVH